MKYSRHSKFKLMAMGGCAAIALATAAHAQDRGRFEIAGGDLKAALQQFATQTDQEVLFSTDVVAGRRTKGVSAEADAPTALAALLDGTGLSFRRTDTGTLLIVQAGEGGSPQADRAAGEVEALIVTAQKREEDIQDVPIAMSAFSQEDLTRSQIAGGPDLMTQIPNMTFTKTNFSSYSIQIRGIGTQAISATTDPAVAVAFNNTPFVRNRFFEQEFFDLQRIEVLRGPQGTLYGRNATAGVVNIISAKPKFTFEAKASGDLGNYANQRLEGMVNIPLVEDAVAIRLAGAWTKRDGYVTNGITGAPIDGRDLWSTRVSLRFAPSDAPFDINLIWEHFEESDDRLRSGKQLCKRHRPEFLTSVDGTQVPIDINDFSGGLGGEASYNQGCERVSLYSPAAFQVPNGSGLPYYFGLQGIGLALRDLNPNPLIEQNLDPYLSATQSRDLRVIESTVEPEYRANSNIFELQANWNITDDLTLTSETSYSTDELFSLQDLNRFNTAPGVFANSSAERVDKYPNYNLLTPGPNGGGVFCDPQIGCSDRLVAMDLSTADSTQFSQELRLGSDFDGPFNFSLGANFLRYDTMDKYYVFINTIALAALNSPFWGALSASGEPTPYVPNVTDNRDCSRGGRAFLPPDPSVVLQVPTSGCLYIDPNPIGSLNDQGHNYFLSKNPYKLISYAVFGEAYYNLTEDLKVTAGVRWTVDRKQAPRIPSMLLAAQQYQTDDRSGSQTIGYTVDEVANQEWREPTGRLALDWKPGLSFTDETLLYASYAHGYKAGGANPPPTAVITYGEVAAEGRLDNFLIFPRTFEPEFIEAFEIGAKNTLLDGKVTLNTAAFYYDYKNYQVSEIVDRAALNRNFDATVWGVEVEADWRPIENLKLSFKGGYEKTSIADGEEAIDLMDRTASDPNYVVVKPFPASPSNCVIPIWLATWKNEIFTGADDWGLCTPIINGLDPVTWLPYVSNPTVKGGSDTSITGNPPTTLFDGWYHGRTGFWTGYPGYDPRTNNNSTGIPKQLGGNELPNAPDFTATVSADYTAPLAGDWTVALHTDVHWQSESWWRIFNDHEYNKIDEFYLINLAAIFTNEEAGWNIMAYVKNVLDEDALTGAFLFSDDTGLTTNVFLTEPRLYGLRVTKNWSGGSLFGRFGERHDGPYPFTLELGGQVQRHDAGYSAVTPTFADEFSSALDLSEAQNQDLDWGDGRAVKLTYHSAANWKFSLGARFGETNGSAKAVNTEFADAGCIVWAEQCDNPELAETTRRATIDNYSDTLIRGREDHTVVDFKVGREFGLGIFDGDQHRSEVGLGLRYAKLGGRTQATIIGVPDWDIPDYGQIKYDPFSIPAYVNSQHNHHEAEITVEREFEGVGPVLSWEGSLALLGNQDIGRLNADVSIAGGVLFGKQDTHLSGTEVTEYFDVRFNYGNFIEPTSITTTPVDISRSSSVTVPVVDLSLGFSYTVDRVKLGAGYRWERYFNAIDGGYDEAEDYDRTIDGPYVKLSVGFGG
jgi:outer membrane receptor protein involved in Fe transport